MIEYISLLLAVPLGLLFSKLTRDEKEIFCKSQYFPVFVWVLVIGAAIFFSLDKIIALTFLFLFIMVFSWWKF